MDMSMTEDTKKTVTAVAVGVGATAAIATAMYFLGGREAPKMPSLGEVTVLAKREIGFGAAHMYRLDLPEAIRNEYAAPFIKLMINSGKGVYHVWAKNLDSGAQWVDLWVLDNGHWTLTSSQNV